MPSERKIIRGTLVTRSTLRSTLVPSGIRGTLIVHTVIRKIRTLTSHIRATLKL